MNSTYTYSILDVSQAVWNEIHSKLEAARYQHAFHDDDTLIDMHGIALRVEDKKDNG